MPLLDVRLRVQWRGERHELQHAIEALSESGVTTSVLLYNFFNRLAPAGGHRFETTTATRVGDAVRNELAGR